MLWVAVIAIKLYVTPGVTTAGNFQMLCLIYEKEHGEVVENAKPAHVVSFGSAPINHHSRVTSIYEQSGTPVESLAGNTGGANSVECTQPGIDPPFVISIPRAPFHAPGQFPQAFEDLAFDLFDVKRGAIAGLADDED